MTGTPTTDDQASTTREPEWPRLVVVRLLLPLGILGALALSGAATVDLAARNHVPGLVQPAAVGMVEVVSIAGTLLAIFATTGRTRGRGMVAVVGLGFVQLVAGAKAYGWFGLIAPIAAVYLVHLAAEAWQELRADRRSSTASTTPATTPTAQLAEPLTSEEPAQAPAPEPVLDEPAPEPVVEPVALDDRPVEGPATLVDDLRSRPALPSERALVLELDPDGRLGTTRHFAKVVLREAKTGLSAVSA